MDPTSKMTIVPCESVSIQHQAQKKLELLKKILRRLPFPLRDRQAERKQTLSVKTTEKKTKRKLLLHLPKGAGPFLRSRSRSELLSLLSAYLKVIRKTTRGARTIDTSRWNPPTFSMVKLLARTPLRRFAIIFRWQWSLATAWTSRTEPGTASSTFTRSFVLLRQRAYQRTSASPSAKRCKTPAPAARMTSEYHAFSCARARARAPQAGARKFVRACPPAIFTIWTYSRYGHIHDMDIFTIWTYSRYGHIHDMNIFTI